ncbi:hypothetical protein [Azospirillum sp. B510]|uniref:hypothetical protein n=1 Tax=Azospirillum sp. (strain B510) TaxID=137722 RepID=UPI0011D0C5B3|nr:hypothetical protein [Azospirillum sp. B510]
MNRTKKQTDAGVSDFTRHVPARHRSQKVEGPSTTSHQYTFFDGGMTAMELPVREMVEDCVAMMEEWLTLPLDATSAPDTPRTPRSFRPRLIVRGSSRQFAGTPIEDSPSRRALPLHKAETNVDDTIR